MTGQHLREGHMAEATPAHVILSAIKEIVLAQYD